VEDATGTGAREGGWYLWEVARTPTDHPGPRPNASLGIDRADRHILDSAGLGLLARRVLVRVKIGTVSPIFPSD
jgi:hypothetical protein